jgi:hypothetical protein
MTGIATAGPGAASGGPSAPHETNAPEGITTRTEQQEQNAI